MKRHIWLGLAVLGAVAVWFASRKKKGVAPAGPAASMPQGVTSVGELTVANWNPPPTPPPDARYFVAL